MKIRGSISRVSFYAAVAFLACSFLLVAAFRITRNSSGHNISTTSAAARTTSSGVSATDKSGWLQAYGNLPLSFMENQGQTAQEVRYVSHGSQYDLFLTPQEAVLALRQTKHFDLSPRHRSASLKAARRAREAATTTAIRMKFEGASPNPQIVGAEKLPGRVNYFIGNDPKKWHTDIPTYAQVKYTQVYPGVDLIFYGNQRKLEYDFVVAPGTDPNVIRMNLCGAKKLRVDSHGDVLVSIAGGEVQLQKPVIYQHINGKRQEIAGTYFLRGDHISFAIAKYDRREPLVVDPILNYASYLGGTADESSGFAIAVDAGGNAYIAGQTFATDFPHASGLPIVGNTNGMGFVTVLNPTASGAAGLIYSTYLGGTNPPGSGDAAFGIAVVGGEFVYVTGTTLTTDFPTTPTALKPTLSSNAAGTSFLTKLDTTKTGSNSLVYSTYLGGNNGDLGNAVAADSTGKAYVTGVTFSGPGTSDVTFPVMNAFQAALPNVNGTAFLTTIDTTQPAATALVYSSYLGGDGANSATANLDGDAGSGVVVDNSGKAYIAGTTASTNFPTSTVTFQTANPANLWGEAFVSEIDTTQSAAASLVYSTYLGGSGNGSLGDFETGIDLQPGTTVTYVTGITDSADFPTTTGAYQTTGDATNGSAFVTLLDTSVGNVLKYSTFLGSAGTIGYSIKADKVTGNAFVAGGTSSASFPVSVGAYQTALATGAAGDAFVSEISPGGKGAVDLLYSTYFGGSGANPNVDQAFGIALATLPTVYITGQTFSMNLPATSGAFQTTLDGTSDAFLAALNLTAPSLTVTPGALSFTATAIGTPTVAQTITLTNNTNSAITFTKAVVLNPVPAAAAVDFAVTNTSCGTAVPALGSCTLSVVFTPTVTAESGTLTITDSDPSSPQTVALTGTAPALFMVAPTSLSFTSSAVGTPTAAQSVTLTNNSSTAVAFTSATVTLTSAVGAVADFALLPANTCGTSIPANKSCAVSITYTASVAATETATLTLVDGATTSPQTVSLTGNVTAVAPGFTLAIAPNPIPPVTRGSTGNATVTVTSVGTFNAAVALACSGQPIKSTCMIMPSSVTPAAGKTATAMLTFATIALVPPPASPRFPIGSIKVVGPIMLVFMIIILLASEQRLRTRLALAGALFVFAVLSGCSGSGSGGTPRSTYMLTVTGTSASFTTQTATVSVTVQ